MLKRLFDVAVSAGALFVLSPIMAAAAIAIRVSSSGPVLYRAARVGLNGKEFTMLKFRTMRVAASTGSAITAQNDQRVFRVGAWLRRTKIDELPQLINVLRGEMSIVGPRPEDPRIVRDHYTPAFRQTLRVRPGLASPGSIYNYTHGEALLDSDDPERAYVERLLPFKLALDEVYARRAGIAYDIRIIARTFRALAAITRGTRSFPEPPETADALNVLDQWRS